MRFASHPAFTVSSSSSRARCSTRARAGIARSAGRASRDTTGTLANWTPGAVASIAFTIALGANACTAAGQATYSANLSNNPGSCRICENIVETVTGPNPVEIPLRQCTDGEGSQYSARASAAQRELTASASITRGPNAYVCQNQQAGAHVVFTDIVFSRTTGPLAPIQYSFSMHVDVQAYGSSAPWSGWSVNADVNTPVGAHIQAGVNYGPMTTDIVSTTGTAELNTPYQMELILGIGMNTNDFTSGGMTAVFSSGCGPVFALPPGYTCNSVSAGIVDNHWSTFYANCDASTVPPLLNAIDFQCFLNRFASGDSRANCDGSTVEPVLNAIDFQCFLNQFAVGCV